MFINMCASHNRGALSDENLKRVVRTGAYSIFKIRIMHF